MKSKLGGRELVLGRELVAWKLVFWQIERMNVKDIPHFEQLTDLERLELAEALASSVRHPEALSAPVAHHLELEKRWVRYEKNPASALTQEQFWMEVKALTFN